ncbi:tissue factor pathway inhibitor-like isoform X2 [Achroia grisella]|uniref:tissue factor pathway inhibitor-like isoform X2 n=1 Tax=Achroia grisella TaxID=688607 RepID=UPI0027D2FC33|nr:tissue factor pathway inhibitor-like isoform X2 [Achroia grisella]
MVSMSVGRKGKRKSHYDYHRRKTTTNPGTKTICMQLDNTLRARHKTCFLRPDTGPCRADIIQWYFDVKQRKCYRFFWGGCQGNGNKFESKNECLEYCYINTTSPRQQIPFFCSLSFDYGNCFGYYNRWTWDKYAKTCKRRLYSGCGGNQNNFESHAECLATCLNPPNNTMSRFHQYTTCIPFNIAELN